MTPDTLPPTTTAEEDLQTRGQRQISLIWEGTQAAVAIAVTLTTLGVCAYQVTQDRGSDGAFLLLSNVFFLVAGTYFQRPNRNKPNGSSEPQ